MQLNHNIATITAAKIADEVNGQLGRIIYKNSSCSFTLEHLKDIHYRQTKTNTSASPNMKGFIASAYVVLAACANTVYGLGSWAGTNLYYLQGMSDSDQDAYINKLSEYNTKVVRLWVNGQSKGCQKGSSIVRDIPQLETTLGQYNTVTLDELDKVLVKLVAKNIKTIISPHDSNSLIGDYRKQVHLLCFRVHHIISN